MFLGSGDQSPRNDCLNISRKLLKDHDNSTEVVRSYNRRDRRNLSNKKSFMEIF